jgi:threonine dehydratase
MRIGVNEARKRITDLVDLTPCPESRGLSRRTGAQVFLKLENQQRSSSFKLRGVASKVLSLSQEERDMPLVAASTGNHGAAFCHVVKELSLEGRLFLPTSASPTKLKAIRATGVPFDLVGDDCVVAEEYARNYAQQNDCILIPPYNDPEVVAGQGTIAAELLERIPKLDAVLVPVGGGGLIGGIGSYLKEVAPHIEIVGCQPSRSAVMYHSVRAGRVVTEESRPTLSDATAGGVEEGSITLDLCQRFVDRWVLMEEEEIARAIRLVYEEQGMVIEGGAALPVAAALKQEETFSGKRIALVITGSRIEEAVLEEILE